MKKQIYIGTSGWHYKHWIGTFYPEGTKAKDQFPFYANLFATVELNNPFYRLPEKQTFANWKAAAPDKFQYSVKANRYITHMKKLKDPEEILDKFMTNVMALEDKLGPILFQLPPGWKINAERFHSFLAALPKNLRYTFEFRNPTWHTNEIYDLLRAYNCALCIYDLAGNLSPIEVTADFVYLRLHGPEGKYAGSYSEEQLKQWSGRCMDWAIEKDVFVYFDNDIGTAAPYNAKRLIELMQPVR